MPSAWDLAAAGPTGFSGPGPSVSSGAGFDAGIYDLSESGGPAGYDASAWDCTGESQADDDTVSVGLGDDITCTITNDDEPATLIVKKVVVNDNGGTKVASDFSFQVNGGAAQSFEADGQNDLTVGAGTYDVTEPGVAGYTTTYQRMREHRAPARRHRDLHRHEQRRAARPGLDQRVEVGRTRRR